VIFGRPGEATTNRLTGAFILIEQGTNATVAAGMLTAPTEAAKSEYTDFAIRFRLDKEFCREQSQYMRHTMPVQEKIVVGLLALQFAAAASVLILQPGRPSKQSWFRF
jgi:hypothetical protein